MSKIRVEVSMVIDAPPEAIYAVISDYRVGHPAILPKPYFSDLTIEQGGQGAGTVIRFYVSLFGQEFHYHQHVTEPEPGRVILETDIETGQFSRFTLDPLNDGKQTRVTIYSEAPASPGVKGFLEQLTQPPISRRLYRQELQQLADYVHHQS
ncbi:MAG: SRPBCC family protein [Anaerolineae bacterium]|nr:SRPBCC family protein [Anaerolineae bacterium]